ncbi:MAG: glycosyltransferase family 2 protein [Isosphaeraceae bacterium]|nr:glycosyltransferase family 2 protein [Isosphaeraceae bacterium]
MTGIADPPAENGGATWVVVPAFNEAENLPTTLALLSSRYPNVVVVDDGSTDTTSDLALRHDVWCLHHIVNCGQGAALQTGVDFALHKGASVIVTFDADGQHSVDDIDALVRPIQDEGADVCLGSRFLGRAVGIPWTRWAVLKLGIVVTRQLSRIKVTDTHNGLRAFSRQAATRIRITENGMAHASEILDAISRLGLRFREVPVTIRYTAESLRKGQDSWNSVRIFGQLIMTRIIR